MSNVDKLKAEGLIRDAQKLSDAHKQAIEKLSADDAESLIRIVHQLRDDDKAIPNFY